MPVDTIDNLAKVAAWAPTSVVGTAADIRRCARAGDADDFLIGQRVALSS
jgi:hypothetical protein